MQQAAVFAIPALLLFVPGFLFYTGYQFSRKHVRSFAGKSLYWLGGHGITLVLVTTLTLLRPALIPDMVVTQLPLIITVVYLLLGLGLRSLIGARAPGSRNLLAFFASYIFSLGLATPGLWMLLMKSWQAFSGTEELLYRLPQDPFWCLLAAVAIFSLQYLSRPRGFWEEAEASLVIISGSYLMGGLWLLALGQPGLLSIVGLAQHLWAAALVAVSAFLFWCAGNLRDPLFAVCGVVGLSAGVYTFISYYPWAA